MHTKDFFISYNSADRTWAEWIAWQLEAEGYSVIIQAWDFRPGGNFILEMDQAAKEAERTLAVLSPSYLNALYTQPEWAAAFKQDPTSAQRKLLPVRVHECKPEGLLAAVVYIDLVNLNEAGAREALLKGVQRERAKPKTAPQFPQTALLSASAPAFPGSLARIWNIKPHRNPHFTGREALLRDLRAALTTQNNAALTQALHGLGGVGKTQLALEYAYRHASAYDIVWWLRAEEPATLAADFAALAHPLDLPEKDAADQNLIVQSVLHWLDHHPNWLLLFDNAHAPADLRPYLPHSRLGHVLITSRHANWAGVAQAFGVKTFAPEEAVAFLQERTGQNDAAAAAALAQELGYLPLALEQAAAYMTAAQKALAQYLALFQQHQQKILERGKPATDYPFTVATTWELAFERVAAACPAAVELLNLCSFLAPEAIPRALLLQGLQKVAKAAQLAALADELTFDDAIMALRNYSLIEAQSDTLALHRLVQAVTREKLSVEEKKRWAEGAVRVIAAFFPSGEIGPDDVRSWTICESLLPHALCATKHAEDSVCALKTAVNLLNQTGLYVNARANYRDAELQFRRALEITEKELGAKHDYLATILNNLSGSLWDRGEYAEAEVLMRKVLQSDEEPPRRDSLKVAQSLNNLAALLDAQGKYVEAEPLYRRSLAIREQQLGPEHPAVAGSLNNLAELLRAQGQYDEAESLYRRSVTVLEKQLGPEHPDVATGLNNLAALLRAKGKYAEAEPLFRRSLAIWEKQLGPEHPNVAASLNNLAGLLDAQGKYSEAEPLSRRSLAIREQQLGPEHPDVATSLNNLAGLLDALGKYSEAEPLYRRSHAIREKQLGPEHPDVAYSLNNLAALLYAQGKYDEVVPLFRHSLAIWEKQLGPEHSLVATSLNNLAELLRAQGKYDEAEPLSRRSLAIREQQLGPEHPDVATSLNNLAKLMETQGKYDEAEPLYLRAVEILEKSLGPEHPNTQTARENYAALLAEMEASSS